MAWTLLVLLQNGVNSPHFPHPGLLQPGSAGCGTQAPNLCRTVLGLARKPPMLYPSRGSPPPPSLCVLKDTS